MFGIVCGANPELPIIMMPGPKNYLSEEEKLRRDIVEKTYKDVVAEGDKNYITYLTKNLQLNAEGKKLSKVYIQTIGALLQWQGRFQMLLKKTVYRCQMRGAIDDYQE